MGSEAKILFELRPGILKPLLEFIGKFLEDTMSQMSLEESVESSVKGWKDLYFVGRGEGM